MVPCSRERGAEKRQGIRTEVISRSYAQVPPVVYKVPAQSTPETRGHLQSKDRRIIAVGMGHLHVALRRWVLPPPCSERCLEQPV